MNYEVFIWLEPAAAEIANSGLLITMTAVVGICMLLGNILVRTTSCEDDLALKAVGNHLLTGAKVCLGGFALLLILSVVAAPFANFTDIYKKTLIYRGINSTLADKSVDTAEKALDLLNKKIDVEMSKLNPLEAAEKAGK
jgi:hypothetical protein